MTWQKARILPTCSYKPEIYNGKEIWVKGKPEDRSEYMHYFTNTRPGMAYKTQFISPRTNSQMYLDVEAVELLPEFAEDVPIINFNDWRREIGDLE